MEQVSEVRGAVPPRQFRVYGAPNLTRLEYFSQISYLTIIMGKKDKIGLFLLRD